MGAVAFAACGVAFIQTSLEIFLRTCPVASLAAMMLRVGRSPDQQ
jgi:hypothetical protein